MLSMLRKARLKDKEMRILMLYVMDLAIIIFIFIFIIFFVQLLHHGTKQGDTSGLDNAGKTTIVKRIMNEDVSTVSPTLGFRIRTVDYGGYKLNIWDVGGQKTLRSYWKNYYEKTDALIWVVDATDRLRVDDCRIELAGLLLEERLTGASLLVLANKTDIDGCMSEDEIRVALQLDAIQTHKWMIFPCSAMTGLNLAAGLAWLVDDAKERLFLY